MNYYYIDPTATTNGTGAIDSPFKTFAALIAQGFTHPCTIALKAGTTLYENVNFGLTSLYNTTGIMSYITSYGTGPKPKWINTDYFKAATALDGYSYRAMHLTARKVQSVTVTGIEFYSRNNLTAVDNNSSCFIWFELPPVTTETDVDVWIDNCKFIGDPITRSGNHKDYDSSVNLRLDAAATNRANVFGVRNSSFFNVARPINIVGNHWKADDITDNSKGTYYSRGVKVENIEMTGISKGGCQFAGVESLNSAYVVDKYQSVMRNITYSKYRWDNALENSDTLYADAGFWTWRCNRIMIEDIYGGGMHPSVTDNEIIDFDYLTWDSVARNIIGFNNGASILFMGNSSTSVQGGARASYSTYSGTYTQAQWFYERRNGQGNNVVEFSLFFNDGIQRLPYPSAGYDYCTNIRSGNINYNNVVRNCVFIDTVSRTSKYLASNNNFPLLAGEVARLVIQDSVYYARYNDGINILKPITDTVNYSNAATVMKNVIAYSAAWTTDNITAAAAAVALAGTCTNVKILDPQIGYIPSQVPVSRAAAEKIKVLSTSPLKAAGSSTVTPDRNGNFINDIWWMKLP